MCYILKNDSLKFKLKRSRQRKPPKGMKDGMGHLSLIHSNWTCKAQLLRSLATGKIFKCIRIGY